MKESTGINSLTVHGIPCIKMSDYLEHREDFKLDERHMLIATDGAWERLEGKLIEEKTHADSKHA